MGDKDTFISYSYDHLEDEELIEEGDMMLRSMETENNHDIQFSDTFDENGPNISPSSTPSSYIPSSSFPEIPLHGWIMITLFIFQIGFVLAAGMFVNTNEINHSSLAIDFNFQSLSFMLVTALVPISIMTSMLFSKTSLMDSPQLLMIMISVCFVFIAIQTYFRLYIVAAVYAVLLVTVLMDLFYDITSLYYFKAHLLLFKTILRKYKNLMKGVFALLLGSAAYTIFFIYRVSMIVNACEVKYGWNENGDTLLNPSLGIWVFFLFLYLWTVNVLYNIIATANIHVSLNYWCNKSSTSNLPNVDAKAISVAYSDVFTRYIHEIMHFSIVDIFVSILSIFYTRHLAIQVLEEHIAGAHLVELVLADKYDYIEYTDEGVSYSLDPALRQMPLSMDILADDAAIIDAPLSGGDTEDHNVDVMDSELSALELADSEMNYFPILAGHSQIRAASFSLAALMCLTVGIFFHLYFKLNLVTVTFSTILLVKSTNSLVMALVRSSIMVTRVLAINNDYEISHIRPYQHDILIEAKVKAVGAELSFQEKRTRGNFKGLVEMVFDI